MRTLIAACSIAGCGMFVGCPDRNTQEPKPRVYAPSQVRGSAEWAVPAAAALSRATLRYTLSEENAMLQKSPMYAYLPATDVARARHFYEQKLGFTPKQEIAGGVVYESGNRTACFLYPTTNAGTSKASQAFWQVDDIEREVAELKHRGVKFEEYDTPAMRTKNGIATGGGAKTAWFKDTEGNILAVVQSYTG